MMRMGSYWFGGLTVTLTTTNTIFPFQNRTLPLFDKVKKKKKNPTLSCSCRYKDRDDASLSIASAYAVLGANPDCSVDDIKAAFRTKVKQFHPDVNRDEGNSDTMIRRVIQAYQVATTNYYYKYC